LDRLSREWFRRRAVRPLDRLDNGPRADTANGERMLPHSKYSKTAVGRFALSAGDELV